MDRHVQSTSRMTKRADSAIKTRRAFLGAAASTLSAFALVRLLPGCSGDEDDASLTRPLGPSPAAPTAPTDDDEHVPGSAPANPPAAPAQPGNAAWDQVGKELCSRNVGGVAYTAASPGPWAGKERSHVPVLTIQADGVAVVIVNHVMEPGSAGVTDAGRDGASDAAVDARRDAAADSGVVATHYVTTIWAKDDKGRVVFMKQFKANEPAPPFIAFKIPAGTTSLVALEHCNIHGAWASAAAKV